MPGSTLSQGERERETGVSSGAQWSAAAGYIALANLDRHARQLISIAKRDNLFTQAQRTGALGIGYSQFVRVWREGRSGGRSVVTTAAAVRCGQSTRDRKAVYTSTSCGCVGVREKETGSPGRTWPITRTSSPRGGSRSFWSAILPLEK